MLRETSERIEQMFRKIKVYLLNRWNIGIVLIILHNADHYLATGDLTMALKAIRRAIRILSSQLGETQSVHGGGPNEKARV